MVVAPTPVEIRTAPEAPKPSRRILAIDIVRGYAMLAMLISHSAWTILGLDYAIAYSWDRLDAPPIPFTQPAHWLGFILHISTPTFFVLAGFSSAFFAASRRRRGWREWWITRFLLIRGAVLIAFDWLVLAWNPYTFSYTHFAHAVLTTIGLSLWVMAFLRRLPLRWLVGIGLALVIGGQVYYATITPATEASFLRSLLLYRIEGDPYSIGMPVLGWLPVMILGFVCGTILYQRPEITPRLTLWVGLALLALWGVVMLGNDFGRFYTAYPLIFTRSPPALAYLSFYLGLSFLLLSLHSRLPAWNTARPVRLLKTLGQAAFVFFLAHGYVLFVFGVPLAFVTLPELVKSAVIVLLTLPVMTLVCAAHRRLRRKYPDSALKYI